MSTKKLISGCVLNTLPEDYRIFDPETICPYDISFSDVDFSQAEDKIFSSDTQLEVLVPTVWTYLIANRGTIVINVSSGNLTIQNFNNNGSNLTINSNDVIAIQELGGNSGNDTISGDVVAETFRNGFTNHTTIYDRLFLKRYTFLVHYKQ